MRKKVAALYPPHEVGHFTELFFARIQAWREDTAAGDPVTASMNPSAPVNPSAPASPSARAAKSGEKSAAPRRRKAQS